MRNLSIIFGALLLTLGLPAAAGAGQAVQVEAVLVDTAIFGIPAAEVPLGPPDSPRLPASEPRRSTRDEKDRLRSSDISADSRRARRRAPRSTEEPPPWPRSFLFSSEQSTEGSRIVDSIVSGEKIRDRGGPGQRLLDAGAAISPHAFSALGIGQ